MSHTRFSQLTAMCALVACQPQRTQPVTAALRHDVVTEADASNAEDDGGSAPIDPTVAHFLNTAFISNNEAAAFVVALDGGTNANTGN